MKHGLLWLARSLQLVASARAEGSDRAIRINVAEWEDRLCRPRASLRLPSPIAELAFSPDGRSLVAVGGDAVVRIIDASPTGGHPMAAAALPTAHAARRIAFLPRGEGLLATADDGRVSFWDPIGWRTTGHLPRAPARQVDPRHGRQPRRPAAGHRLRRRVDPPLGRLHGRSHRRGPVGRRDRRPGPGPDPRWSDAHRRRRGRAGPAVGPGDGAPIDPPLRHDAAISAIACGRDGRSIVVGTRDGRLHVWDWRAPACPSRRRRGPRYSTWRSPGRGDLRRRHRRRLVRLWDFHRPRHPVQTVMLGGAVTRVAFHAGGGALATGQDDGTIRLWAAPRSPAIGRPIQVGRPVEGLSFRDGSRLLVVTGGEARASTSTAVGPAHRRSPSGLRRRSRPWPPTRPWPRCNGGRRRPAARHPATRPPGRASAAAPRSASPSSASRSAPTRDGS